MSDLLIIVESPAKVETIKKYLGSNYVLQATFGHIKDLPVKRLGVDLNKDFEPSYVVIPSKKKIVKKIQFVAEKINDVFLAPDPDREGEAISWHVFEVLNEYNRKFYRVLFNELTKSAISIAVSNPSKLNKNRYKAQQSRRILDRIVGYEISSLLWKKVKRGISAGRVQSVSVRVICERERKIQVHNPKGFWSTFVYLEDSSLSVINARLRDVNKKKKISTKKEFINKVREDLNYNVFFVFDIKEKLRKISSKPPFTTSELQQESIKKLNFSSGKTMVIAQQLYEGVIIGCEELTGLITYMRTDSIRLSEYAVRDSLNFIGIHFGRRFVPKKIRNFKNKRKVQDSHEAIRPTYVLNTPELIKPYLLYDQVRLYTMIWDRFVSSQIEKSIISYTRVDIKSGRYIFSVREHESVFVGFKILYKYKRENVFDCITIPIFKLGDSLKLKKIGLKQRFTSPPYRFTEASLVKELEENEIGRPSTYSTIVHNIRTKGYVEIIGKNYKPTELGIIVNDLLISVFPEIMNVYFTAKMEYKLDRIEQAKINNIRLLNDFYIKFNKKLDIAKRSLLNVSGIGVATNINCPECKNKQLRIKMGINGQFISCEKYPKCTYSSNYYRDSNGNIKLAKLSNVSFSTRKCGICRDEMIIKYGKYGEFLACKRFPKCKNTISINIFNKTQIVCPEKKCFGNVEEKFSKKGKFFYGCEKFPSCNFASWNKPVNIVCRKCGLSYLVEKKKKKERKIIMCPNFYCNYILSV